MQQEKKKTSEKYPGNSKMVGVIAREKRLVSSDFGEKGIKLTTGQQVREGVDAAKALVRLPKS